MARANVSASVRTHHKHGKHTFGMPGGLNCVDFIIEEKTNLGAMRLEELRAGNRKCEKTTQNQLYDLEMLFSHWFLQHFLQNRRVGYF